MASSTPLIVLKELAGNPPPHLNAIQQLLEPHADLLVHFWKAVWLLTAIAVIVVLWYAYKEQKNNTRE